MTDETLDEWMDALIADEPSEEGADRLSDRLREDEAARERFLQLADVQSSSSDTEHHLSEFQSG